MGGIRFKTGDLFTGVTCFAICKILSIGVNQAVFARKIY
jgi:hypothetical protein